MPADNSKTFMVEDARIIFRNFSGAESKFNDKGDRNFAVILDPVTAEAMLADGWNVKYLKPREIEEEEEVSEPTPYIQVAVSFKNYPPRVTMLTSTARTPLDGDSIGALDWADIQKVDLIARGYDWQLPSGKSGTKAYLKTMFVTVEEDELERKYSANGPEDG